MPVNSYDINDMMKFAKKRDGKCLSNKYINMHTKLRWECKEGHIWNAEPTSIVHNNTWCKICSGNGSFIDNTKYITYKCDECGKSVKRYKCEVKDNNHKFCSMRCRNKFVEADIAKDEFYHLYFIQMLPINHIAQIYNVSEQAIYSKVNKYGFKLRNGVEASKNRLKYPENHPMWIENRNNIICSNCGIGFHKIPSSIEKCKYHFCCRDCHTEWQKKNLELCGINNLHKSGKFHNNWKGGKKLYWARSRKRRKRLKFELLFENPFSNEVKIDYHHINDILVIPLPRKLHKMCNYGNDYIKHREECNKWISYIYGFNMGDLLYD